MTATAPFYLNRDNMLFIVKHTPLVSIDLIIRNPHSEIFLGFRTNRPAKNFWFVPGGRICKNERINDAMMRISSNEFGVVLGMNQVFFKGVYEHLYEDDFTGENQVGTHYVVLAYEAELDLSMENLPMDQHSQYKWFSVNDILRNETVHENTKAYFR